MRLSLDIAARPSLPPPLKWAGGKRWLLPYLRPLWGTNQTRRLVEPFCGGLAVSLGLLPQSALLNDINEHLVAFYRWLQRGLVAVQRFVNDEEHYYAARQRFNTLVSCGKADTQEAAELFYYLNRTGYNGLCRFNSKGQFNVPYGKYKHIEYVRDFSAYKETLAGWDFSQGDFDTLKLTPEDWIYADPPYDVPFTKYSKEDFSWDDQVRLAQWLTVHPGPVVASNQATERILDLYESLGFATTILHAPRRISCNGDRTPAPEILATRNVKEGLLPRWHGV